MPFQPIDCPECGQTHLRGCRAHRKHTRGPCLAAAVTGTSVCKMHGGLSPQARAVGKRRREQAVLEKAMRAFGLPIEIDPAQALLQEVHRTAGHVAWLAEQVAKLSPDELGWGKTSEEHVGAAEYSGVNVTYTAQPPVVLDLYQRERKHLREVCTAAIAAGIAERHVRLAEQQGALVAQAIRAILDDLNLTPEQQQQVPEVVPRRLRALTELTG